MGYSPGKSLTADEAANATLAALETKMWAKIRESASLGYNICTIDVGLDHKEHLHALLRKKGYKFIGRESFASWKLTITWG